MNKIFAITSAVMMLYIIVLSAAAFTWLYERPPSREQLFEVHRIYVPDHRAGSNPRIIYAFTVYEPFTGEWRVQLRTRLEDGLFQLVCAGEGEAPYEPEKELPEEGVTFNWFIGLPNGCEGVKPGLYRISASYRISWSDGDGRVYQYLYRVRSNEFKIM